MSLMTGYRCIYCGRPIPADIGLSCPGCSKKGRDEFAYADELQPHIAEIMERVERESDRVKGSAETREEAFRLHELNVKSREEYRWPNQEELKAKREGKIYHMNEFLRLFRSIGHGIDAWYTETSGMEGTRGLFIQHYDMKPKCQHPRGEPHYVGFVQIPFMQEYEELYFDEYDVPKGSKRRGWRTVLLRAVEQKIVTEQEVHSVFGEPALNFVSRRYREYLQYLRGLPQE